MELTIDQALQKAVEAHKAGQITEADRLYTAILKAQPKHPDANHNLGVLAVGVGKVHEALPFFKMALEAKPSIAQFWISYIDTLIKLDRKAEAKAFFDQAKSRGYKSKAFVEIEKIFFGLKNEVNNGSKVDTPEPPSNQLENLIKLHKQGQYQKVLSKALHLQKDYSTSKNLFNIIGITNHRIGRLNEAIDTFIKALSFYPESAQIYNNLGNALASQGNYYEAASAYETATFIQPNYAEAYYNMGNAFRDRGSLYKAVEAYAKAVHFRPKYIEAFNNMGNAIKDIVFTKPKKDLLDPITALLDQKTSVRPKDIAKAAISLLKLQPELGNHLKLGAKGKIDNPLDVISDLSDLPLLLKLMSVCPLPDLSIEKLLTKLRHLILTKLIDKKQTLPYLLNFQSALALQCFTNEYIYTSSEEEDKALLAVEKTVKNALRDGVQPSPIAILVLASYKALKQYEWHKLLIVDDSIKDVFERQVTEPSQEEILKQKFSTLQEIADRKSSEVRAQYEQSPYPRWVNLGLPLQPLSIAEVISEVQLELHSTNITSVKKPEILIAGCGTGQHSIQTATVFKSAKVLAIDLSLSSLAYAKRKTDELGIENIEYMQADILDLGHLDKQFDIIECAGVLHHMANPMAGWRLLTDRLKLGGLMKIALYSKYAREHIVEIRKEIKETSVASSDAEIKSFREMLITSDLKHHKRILNSTDFYSLSTIKDLLFHVQEHRFTLPQIQDHLDKLKLKFCAFEGSQIISHFKQGNTLPSDPYDLGKWHDFEMANPSVFSKMYQFWCQKIA